MSKDILQNGKSKNLQSPIGRVGGKSKLAKEIITLFPNNYKDLHYVEVFG
jgi:site-specific DNA-adenine methylase